MKGISPPPALILYIYGVIPLNLQTGAGAVWLRPCCHLSTCMLMERHNGAWDGRCLSPPPCLVLFHPPASLLDGPRSLRLNPVGQQLWLLPNTHCLTHATTSIAEFDKGQGREVVQIECNLYFCIDVIPYLCFSIYLSFCLYRHL